ncbi:MAG: glutaredoxin 3 [Alphaproteobacteria bacterium]|nr:MAG: glutaredoxin 3 [Alphaproteobacteria bacterium]
MPKIELYTGQSCPYCVRAKALLRAKGQEFQEVDIWADPTRMQEMIERSGGKRSVPQIFINGQHIGGYDDLHALDQAGGLDPLLA